jgi:hypothetical protein
MVTVKSNLSTQLGLKFALVLCLLLGMWIAALLNAEGAALRWTAVVGIAALAICAATMWSTLNQIRGVFRKPIESANQIVAGNLAE